MYIFIAVVWFIEDRNSMYKHSDMVEGKKIRTKYEHKNRNGNIGFWVVFVFGVWCVVSIYIRFIFTWPMYKKNVQVFLFWRKQTGKTFSLQLKEPSIDRDRIEKRKSC